MARYSHSGHRHRQEEADTMKFLLGCLLLAAVTAAQEVRDEDRGGLGSWRRVGYDKRLENLSQRI